MSIIIISIIYDEILVFVNFSTATVTTAGPIAGPSDQHLIVKRLRSVTPDSEPTGRTAKRKALDNYKKKELDAFPNATLLVKEAQTGIRGSIIMVDPYPPLAVRDVTATEMLTVAEAKFSSKPMEPGMFPLVYT